MRHLKGVIRIEQGFYGGWQARVSRDGKYFTKMFADTKHGGIRGARRACHQWVIAWHEEHGKPYVPRPVVTRARSSTGIVGVCRDATGALRVSVHKDGRTTLARLPHNTPLRRARLLRQQMYQAVVLQEMPYA